MTPEQIAGLAEYAKRLASQSDHAQRKLEPLNEGLESLTEPESPLDSRGQEILYDVVAGKPLDEESAQYLEAIILPGLRPVLTVKGDGFDPVKGEWVPMNANKDKIVAAIQGVGRINLVGHPRLAYGGTGFLVGPGLLLTNRHVASIFVNGLGDSGLSLTFQSIVDLKEELDSDASIPLKVKSALMIHPYWDAALLRVEGVPASVKPLQLASDSSGFGNGTLITVVGYPAFDPRNNVEVQRKEFNNIFEKKRLQPGYLNRFRPIESYGNQVEAITHDASTLGGNSGSAVIDVATGTVVALHFAGIYKDANFAVPAWELARDKRVTDLGVNFGKASLPAPPAPKWLKAWSTFRQDSVAHPQQPPPPPPPPSGAQSPASGSGDRDGSMTELSVTIPIHVTIRVGNPIAEPRGGQQKQQPVAQDGDPLALLRRTRASIKEDPDNYYDEETDQTDIASYYSGIDPNDDPGSLFRALSELLQTTHTTRPKYKPTVHLYPVVDLHPDGDLRSIYSDAMMNPEALIAAEAPVEAMRESIEAREGLESPGLEALVQNSAEHVVPQSWFKAKEPMRGDLHHLFACESRCNSFRGNIPFFEFTEEKVMEDCGRRETLQFEPRGGKGQVARAVLYFLMRYPGEINNKPEEYTPDRIRLLLDWHARFDVTLYERHRNREIFLKQGNRNPLIDHPDWAAGIDFLRGLGSA